MIIIQPSRKTFWRTVFLISAVLPWLSIWQSILLARNLEVFFLASTSWMAFLISLFLLGCIPLLAWTLPWSRYSEWILSWTESPERALKNVQWFGWGALIASIIGYTAVFTNLFVQKLLGDQESIRLLVFWYFSLIGVIGIKTMRQGSAWFTSLISVVLLQSTFHLLAVQYSYVTDYPFSMGWSETSRYYHPSFFFSNLVYGERYPLPIINSSLHLLLSPPYLFDAPLWAHRFWHIVLRHILLAMTALAVTKRFSVQNMNGLRIIGVWVFLYLLYGPLYLHLTIPVLLILFGYSSRNDRKTWLFLLLASAWCGWSRVNWYPVPAIIAAVLYVLETSYKGKTPLQYLIKPTLWGIAGLVTAFSFQRIYILISGIENTNYFYTHLVSDLLWYRLLPNATLSTGILPMAIEFSIPMWIVMYLTIRAHKGGVHPLRIFLLVSALIVLFAVGVIVSLKIGGGADLHNMDSYFIVLLLIVGYLVFAKFVREDGTHASPLPLHWVLVILLMIMPVWAQLRSNASIITYDRSRTDALLSVLQEQVDQVNSQSGDILFITQRHLISMDMLHDVSLVPEYEREDLMEMAMGGNLEYLAKFQKDMVDQRFSIIVVDLLKFKYLGSDSSFGEENNVWVRHVMKPILCNYQMDEFFPEDDIALYVPQIGERQCPQP